MERKLTIIEQIGIVAILVFISGIIWAIDMDKPIENTINNSKPVENINTQTKIPTSVPSTNPKSSIQLNSYQSFNGYTCTDDCSGHEAGYEWAEEHDITQDDVDSYYGGSNSFQEGMQSYVDENGY